MELQIPCRSNIMDSEDLEPGNSCCQDFASTTHDGTGGPLPHRCCKMGGGKIAILVPRFENTTSENFIKRNLGNNEQALCHYIDYGLLETIKYCHIHTTISNISSAPANLTDRSGITTVHQTADLTLVICTSVIVTFLL